MSTKLGSFHALLLAFSIRAIDKCRILDDNTFKDLDYPHPIEEVRIALNETSTTGIWAILGLKALGESPLDMITAVRNGLSYKAVSGVAEVLHLSTGQLAKYLPVTERTLQRYQKEKQKLDRDLSDHLLQIARVFARCQEVMEDSERARRWLQTPSLPLGNIPPITLLDTYTGVEMVMDELGRIEHGIAA
jgi:putative toxin-antitoxin system antitoxin component (TIGR02293 family)